MAEVHDWTSAFFLFQKGEKKVFTTINMIMADGTTKEFEFVSNGLTQYRYKQLTGQDLMKSITKLINRDLDYIGDDADFTCVDYLAYIMNMSATKADMNRLNTNMFYEWIEQFDSSNALAIYTDIINAYFGTKKSTSEPKKEDGE